MNWPTSQDYNEAIQNAVSSFADPGLKRGAVTVNALGLPVPRSGNFADVYQFRGGDGKMWAVKCFTRKVAGLQERYAKIDEHLAKIKLPFTVGFKYFQDGIRVRGQWFPLLKMEWVEGFTLNEFVRNNADKPKYLHALLQMWAKLTARLRDGNLAHADLQHDNVLLVPGGAPNKLGLKLIDYDGMWVPALADKHSGEIGHPNFQHPLRLKDRLYSAEVDRFPHLVIASALRATLLGGRALWDRFDNGDNLLFKETDLRDLTAAPVFEALWELNDDVLCTLLGKMALASRETLSKTPWLDHLLLTEEGRRLRDEEEQKVRKLAGVSPHFTASAAAKHHAPVLEEFNDFAFDDDTSEKPAQRAKPANKIAAKKGQDRKAKSKLPQFIGGGVLAVALMIGGIIALSSGGKSEPSQAAVAKNDRPQLVRVVAPAGKKEITAGPLVQTKKDTKVELTSREPGEVAEVEIAKGMIMKFCWVPAGNGKLGSPATEKERGTDETEHEFTTKGFWLGKYAVTQEQWKAVMGNNPSWFSKQGRGKDQVQGLDTSRFPVEEVSWNDCQDFLKKLNEKVIIPATMGKSKFALPHEDEWEYACRGGEGNQQQFYFGDQLNGAQANCNGNDPYGTRTKGECLGRTTEVGSYENVAPHPWGLCDMSGNVWQWCETTYNSQNYRRRLRGGSWFSGPGGCRSAYRGGGAPGNRDVSSGLRVVVVSP
jgi:formylglycine-generating enzyme required for sulfatase activity